MKSLAFPRSGEWSGMRDKKNRQFLAKPGRNLVLFFRKVRMPISWRVNADVAVETLCDRVKVFLFGFAVTY
jgi:hypothetical protein